MIKGFTLLEILIVVGVIGVLSLIAPPVLLNLPEQAKDGSIKANISVAVSTVTSELTLQKNNSPDKVLKNIVTSLNANNTNPLDSTSPAFATSGTTPGSVVLTCNDTAGTVNIVGYRKDGSAILTKIVNVPKDS
jgi:prepilin-type N-terminal cleavage/methylation domain-containing protein